MTAKEDFEHKPPDGGWYAWFVVLASAWVNGTVFGTVNCFGVVYVYMLDELEGANAFKTSWIGSACTGLTFMLSPIASMLTDKFGCRATGLLGGALASAGMFASSYVSKIEFMYLTYGLALGTGFSIAYTPSMIIIGHYFKKRIGLANGIMASGSAVFTIILPLLLEKVLQTVGLRLTLRYMTGVIIIMALCALTYTPILPTKKKKNSVSKTSSSSNSKEPRRSSFVRRLSFGRRRSLPRRVSVFNRVGLNPAKHIDKSIWQERNFLIWVTALPIGFLGYFVPFFHLVKHLKDILPDADAPLVITCIGATSGVGRLMSGLLSDSPRVNRVFIQQLSMLVIGVVTTLLPITVNFVAVLIAVCIMGLFDGAMVCMMGPIAFDLVGPLRASQALGFVLGFMSVPMTLGPPIAGWIYDLTGSYEFAFIFAGFPPILGACLMMLIRNPGSDKNDTSKTNFPDHEEYIGEDDFVTENEAMMKQFKREPSVRRPSTRSRVEWKPDTVESLSPDGTTAMSLEDVPEWQRKVMEQKGTLPLQFEVPNGVAGKGMSYYRDISHAADVHQEERVNEACEETVASKNPDDVSGRCSNEDTHEISQELNGMIEELNGMMIKPNKASNGTAGGSVQEPISATKNHKKTQQEDNEVNYPVAGSLHVNGHISDEGTQNRKLSPTRKLKTNIFHSEVKDKTNYTKLPEVESSAMESIV